MFWIAEGVHCTRSASPVGRLILADSGLYFVPGRRSSAARRTDQPWLSHALSDDDGLEDPRFIDVAARAPADQVAAIPGSLHVTRTAITDLTLAGRELTVSADDQPLHFTLPPVLGEALAAWCAAVGHPN